MTKHMYTSTDTNGNGVEYKGTFFVDNDASRLNIDELWFIVKNIHQGSPLSLIQYAKMWNAYKVYGTGYAPTYMTTITEMENNIHMMS